MQNIGRNDPCPCNSGKKYKHCHMKSILQPQEQFIVDVKGGNIGGGHLESPDGKTWNKLPGTFQFRVFYEKETFPEIDEIITQLLKQIPENRIILRARIFRLKHKMRGIRYHLEKFVEHEEMKIKEFSSDYSGTDHDAITFDPKLVYELESFLFQIKSCFDVITQIISISYRLPQINTFSKDGETITKTLKQNTPQPLKPKSIELVNIINKNKNWMSDVIDMRDEVTHYSDLEGFLCFIQHMWTGSPTTKISYPSMPDGKRASKYMKETWNRVLDFIKEVIPYY